MCCAQHDVVSTYEEQETKEYHYVFAFAGATRENVYHGQIVTMEEDIATG